MTYFTDPHVWIAVGIAFIVWGAVMLVQHAIENAAEMDENGNLHPPKNKRKK